MTIQLWIVRWAITRGQFGYDLRSFVTGMMECKDDDPCHDPKVEHIVFKRDFTPWKRTVIREVNEKELEYLSKWGETKVPIFLGESCVKLILAKGLWPLAVLLSFSACAQESHETQATSCRAPGMAHAIEEALCSGNPSDLRTAIFNDSSAPGPSTLTAFQRVFDGDTSYGKALPWNALKTQGMRAIIAEYLAQAIRNGEYEGSLHQLEQFAIQFVREAKSDSDKLDGIRLLGIVDSRSEIPVLRATALSQQGSPTRRAYAIDALGRICAPEAAAALNEIERAVPLGAIEAKHLATARSDRERLQRSWCRTPASLPESSR